MESNTHRYQQPLPLHLQSNGHDPISTPASNASEPISNLCCFLQNTTPMVPTHLLCTQSCLCTSSQSQRHFYFSLNDLWESFGEWSAYGAGVPIVLHGKESVTQYYVPYLSAIQLYSSSSSNEVTTKTRKLEDDNNGSEEEFTDCTSSEVSSDSDVDFRDSANEFNLDREHKQTNSCCCNGPIHKEPWSPTTSTNPREKINIESPVFEYFESNGPGTRAPMYATIADLAKGFPDLKKLCSNDLSLSSWMSVARYPIYRIPSGVTLEHVGTSFLTFHSISTSFPADEGGKMHVNIAKTLRFRPAESQVALEPFGLAADKFQSSVWTDSTRDDDQTIFRHLQNSSYTWLHQLNVDHPDFKYYMSRVR